MVKTIGSGSFGHVYLVKNSETQTLCVIKQLYLMSAQQNFVAKAQQLFQQEAEILKQINHPQVPKLIDYFEQEGQFFLVQDYIEGETLKSELIVGQPWSEQKVIDLLQECLDILKVIHNQGIIHRDIKPDNLIRCVADQKLVLIDFGAVKQFNLDQSRLIDRTSAIGTPWYMPKEQFDGKPYKNSDIYALGIIAIQALTGKKPADFDKNDDEEIIVSQQGINPALANILHKMTLGSYKKRYQSAPEVLTALKNYQQPSSIKNDRHLLTPPEIEVRQTTSQSSIKPNNNSSSNSNSNSNLTNNPAPVTKLNVVLDWLKSPLGSTVTTALTIGLVATGGIYLMNQSEITRTAERKEEGINTLKNKYDQKAYTQCYESAEDSKEEENNVIPNKVLTEYIGLCRFEEAKQKARLTRYDEALEILAPISQEYEYYTQVQIQTEDWSKKIFEKAKSSYKIDGNLEEALEKIDTIPPNKIKEAALINLSQWQEEHQKNTSLLNQANQDLEYEYCSAAIKTASQIYGTDYWLLQAKKIVDKAEKCLKDQGNVNIQPITPDNSNQLPEIILQPEPKKEDCPPGVVCLCDESELNPLGTCS